MKSSLLKLACAAALAMVMLTLNACSDGPNQSSAANEAKSRQLRPTDSQVAAIYDRSCRSCHTIAATGAPLTGDTVAWTPRMAKGMPTLVDNVVGGFGGMPPFGMCMDCSAEEFETLITFMATDPQTTSGKVSES